MTVRNIEQGISNDEVNVKTPPTGDGAKHFGIATFGCASLAMTKVEGVFGYALNNWFLQKRYCFIKYRYAKVSQ